MPALALVRPRGGATAKQRVQFRAEAASGPGVFELDVYDIVDPIGENYWFGTCFVSAKDVRAKLKAAGDINKIVCRINSVGGDVFDGTAIYNLLKDHPARVEVHVDGICASIASIIAMAGDDITMGQGTWMMIHCPYSQMMVDALSDDLRKAAYTLDKMRDAMAAVYCERTGIKQDECISLMQEETWMTAEEALEQGFCTAINSVPLVNEPDQESEIDSDQVEAMVAELTRECARIPAGALQAMKTATTNYAIAAMAAASGAARPSAEADDKDVKQLKEDKQMLQDEITDLKQKLKKAEEEADKAKKAEEDRKAEEDKKAKAAAPPPPKKDDDDDDDDDSSDGGDSDKARATAEAAAIARLALTAQSLTGAKTVAEAEKMVAAAFARNNRAERLEDQVAALQAERIESRVSECIAKGLIRPSRKDYMLGDGALAEAKKPGAKPGLLTKAVALCTQRIEDYLSASGGEVIGPVVVAEHKQPSVPQLMTAEGKGIITAQDREVNKHVGLSEEALQASADLRAQRFGNAQA